MYTEVTDFIEIYQSVNMDCDSIINWFINNKDKQGSGIIYRDTDVLVDIDTKDTFHFESSGATHRKRILTWMVYLNDVPDGGNTVFPYYNYSIQPIKGHILIWPAEFTHTHFGDVVIDEKYIVTGWFNLVEKNQFFMQRPTVTKEKVIYFNI